MGLFSKKNEMPDGPPSYDELQSQVSQNDAPLYQGPYGQNEYPEEKGSGSSNGSYTMSGSGSSNQVNSPQYNTSNAPNYGPNYGPNNGPQYGNAPNNFNQQQAPYPQGTYSVPANTYAVPLQQINIAYDTEGKLTRPGYKEYLQRDQQRVAQGDVPKPRAAYPKGAPLAPSRKGGSSSGFPGARGGATYHNASENK